MYISRIGIVLPGSIVGSIWLLHWWQAAWYPWWIWGICGACVLLGTLLYISVRTRLLGVCVCTMGIGITAAIIAVARTTVLPTEQRIDWYNNDQFVTLEGVIAAEPDKRPLLTRYTIEVIKAQIEKDGQWQKLSGKVLATDRSGWPDHMYGQHVTVSGRLRKPWDAPDGSYTKFLAKSDIYTIMDRVRITPETQVPPWSFMGTLIGIKWRFENQISSIFAEPHASLLAGLLTGTRRGIPKDVLDHFQTTGLTHIIAISGYNITIIITLLSHALFFVPRQWRLWPSIATIVVFTLFVGASASVVRAAIMGILGVLAVHSGRINTVRRSVLWTLCFMLLWNPKYLWYDVGFQLSFLAVIGMTELSPLFEKIDGRIPEILGIRESLRATIAAQVFAIPWITLKFGTISLISPLANIIVAPFLPLAMLFGFIGTILSFVLFPLGQLINYLAWASMEAVIHTATIFSKIPYASIELTASIFHVIAWYGATILIVIIIKKVHIKRQAHLSEGALRRAQGDMGRHAKSLSW